MFFLSITEFGTLEAHILCHNIKEDVSRVVYQQFSKGPGGSMR